jgi:aldehyde dehydrogenase (NAD+)
VKDKFVQELKNQVTEQWGSDPKTNELYGRLIHEAHVKRTVDMLKGHEDKIIAKYGEVDVKDKFFPPTIVLNPDLNTQLMKEEIFAPILPVFDFDSSKEVISFLLKQGRPLGVYYFGDPQSALRHELEENTVSGGFVVNDCGVHYDLPFGGVGDSGYGSIHGRTGKLL